ncbi:hypothetical protein MATL_G00048070 [Megalops atlanticus]|uniref:Translation initiation factor IF-3, mitochondrial n=1 Tax=Megalops atlanticus TaxID=7932 RepID=A0A9D3QED3_MEGAT|nr:hypothetical protein MATL_G00048070 [Megalops atlanticus]
MSMACLRQALSLAATGVCHCPPPLWRSTSMFLLHRGSLCSMGWGSVLSTVAGGVDDREAPKKKQLDPRARSTVSSVGRKIHHRHLQVIGQHGEDLGTMHRADVLRLMDQQGLKLVALNENKDPPVYQLMTGKQIHEEQLKLREKQKNKAGPVQVKELSLSSDIASHDLDTKLRQIQSWLDKKYHVRVTLRKGRVTNTEPLESVLEQFIQRMPAIVGFVSKPKLIRDGAQAMCTLRSPSEKELRQQGLLRKEPIQPPATQSDVHDANPATDSTNGSQVQQ